MRDRGRQAPPARRGAIGARGTARDRLRRHAPRQRGGGGIHCPRARRGGGGVPRRAAARRPGEHPGAVHVRRGAGDRRHQRVRHGDRQGQREDGLPRHRARARSRPTTRRPVAPDGTAPRPDACCSPNSATRACTCSSSSVRGSTPACSSGSPNGCGGRGSTGATTSPSASWPPMSGPMATPPGRRSEQSSGTSPARDWWRRSPPRRIGPRGLWFESGTARALASCLGSARDAERARWAQYRSVWAYVEGSGCRRAALLAHFGDRSRAEPSVACCDVCSPEAARRRRRRPRRWGPVPARPPGGDQYRASARPRGDSPAPAPRRRDPRGGRLGGAPGRPNARGRDPPGWSLEGHRRARVRPARGLRRVRPHALERGPRPGRSAARGRDAPLHGRPVPEAPRRMNVARARVGRRHQPPGAARPGSRPRRR